MNAPPSLISTKEVYRRIGRGKTWLWKAIKEGSFPGPVVQNKRGCLFAEAEISAWISSVIARRGQDLAQ
ncbi:MAG: hypothetical protein GC191_08910 [Azospirillum sp.]|nr:hypothetical protein [Azospirillum sp.]